MADDSIRLGIVVPTERPAVWCRKVAFRSGPQSHWFFACEEHRKDLDPPPDLFFVLEDCAVEPVDPDDDATCDFCRED